MTWVKQLKREYAAGRRKLEIYHAQLQGSESNEQIADEIAIVESMITDMNYAIEWMRSGRQPNRRRGVDVHDAYKRSILMNMDLLPNTPPEQEIRITIAQKQAAVKVLMLLSPRELECYLLHASNGLSYAEISQELKLSKGTVQDYVKRAKVKVAQAL